MSEVEIVLGGKNYVIKPLPLRGAREWREKLKEPFWMLSKVLKGADKIELSDGSNLSELINALSATMFDAPDKMFELLCDYAPDIKADADLLLDTAYDVEVQAAFVEVLKLAYPFGQILTMLKDGRVQM